MNFIYVHRLWILDVDNRKALILLCRKEAKLDLLDLTRGCARVGQVELRHDRGGFPETMFP